MDNEILLEKYSEIEKRIIPFKDFLECNKDKPEYKGLYKGILTLQSPLIYNPEILFIGINPGPGAYNVMNPKKDSIIKKPLTNNTPLRMMGEKESFLRELSWFEKGNARGYSENKKWNSFEWFQRNRKINNPFPQRMIDLLYEVAKLKFPKESVNSTPNNNSIPFWFESFGKRIMYTNLYPIATTDVKDLKSIFNQLIKTSEIQSLLKKSISHNSWELQKHFINGIDELVQLTKPKIIVCIGTSAFNDFTFTNERKTKRVFQGKKGDFNVIGFSRAGNWAGSIPEIAKLIFEQSN